MTDAIDAVRRSHERFASLVSSLSPDQVRARSYDDDWSIADVASHLGSQAEIFAPFLEAGRNGTEPPGRDSFPPIWDRWNAKEPTDQVADSVTANEAFVAALEAVPSQEQADFTVELFGTDQDLDGFATFRLREHAVHTWDVAVALDPTATLSPDAVRILLDVVPELVARAGQAVPGAEPVTVVTPDPDRAFRIVLDPEIRVEALTGSEASEGSQGADVRLPAEALVRLVYGRLDPAHTPDDVDDRTGRLDDLRRAFPGF